MQFQGIPFLRSYIIHGPQTSRSSGFHKFWLPRMGETRSSLFKFDSFSVARKLQVWRAMHTNHILLYCAAYNESSLAVGSIRRNQEKFNKMKKSSTCLCVAVRLSSTTQQKFAAEDLSEPQSLSYAYERMCIFAARRRRDLPAPEGAGRWTLHRQLT